MTIIRHLVALTLIAAATATALAGGPLLDRAPIKGIIAPAERCAADRAEMALRNNGMQLVATVPRLAAAHRFVVDWKSETFAVMVRASDCAIDVVDYAARIRPYCDYIPGPVSACPRPESLVAQ